MIYLHNFKRLLVTIRRLQSYGKTLVAKTITNKGVPVTASNTFEELATGIGTMAGNQYQAGVVAGKDGMYTKAQYDAAYNSGYNSGKAQPKHITLQIGRYECNDRPGYYRLRIILHGGETLRGGEYSGHGLRDEYFDFTVN